MFLRVVSADLDHSGMGHAVHVDGAAKQQAPQPGTSAAHLDLFPASWADAADVGLVCSECPLL